MFSINIHPDTTTSIPRGINYTRQIMVKRKREIASEEAELC